MTNRVETMPSHIATMVEGCSDIILVIKNQSGWTPLTEAKSLAEADEWVSRQFNVRKPTPQERKRAVWNAIFGWGPAVYPVD